MELLKVLFHWCRAKYLAAMDHARVDPWVIVEWSESNRIVEEWKRCGSR